MKKLIVLTLLILISSISYSQFKRVNSGGTTDPTGHYIKLYAMLDSLVMERVSWPTPIINGSDTLATRNWTRLLTGAGGHVHLLTDTTIQGILPYSKGGTGQNGSYFTDGKFIVWNASESMLESSTSVASDFAAWDHNHSGTYEPVISTLPYSKGGTGQNGSYFTDGKFTVWNASESMLESSTYSSSSFALYDHNHSGVYQPAFTVLSYSKGGTGQNGSYFTNQKFILWNASESMLESSTYSSSDFASWSHSHAAGDITSGTFGIATGGTNNTSFTDYEFLCYRTSTGKIQSSGFSSGDFASAFTGISNTYTVDGQDFTFTNGVLTAYSP